MNQPTCPKCGAALPPDAPAGLCPKCLLAAGFESQPVGPADPAATEASPAPAAGFVPPTPAELAARFPQLEVLELLGKGGMGAVYKARQPGLDRLVAIKILPPEISRAPGFAERFMREARALARLSHPHIVAVYDFGQVDGLYYFIMEYVDGVNLRQAIQAGSMNPPQALAIVPQICEALQFAHDEGVVHRDIKPENVLIDKRGRVKIADFGLAKLAGHEAAELSLTGTHQVMGTVRYMAPEQLEGSKSVDHRADIYSLGVVFYELLTGELPLGRFAPPSQRVQLDVRLDEVVLRALEKEPAQRYQHASELKTRVDEISTSGGQRVAAGAASPGRVTDLAPPAPDARLSKCALVGALWASMCVPGLLATATMWLSRSVSSIPPLPANMQVHDAPLNLAFGSVPLKLVAPTFGFLISPAGLLLAIVAGILGLMGLTAPLGTTTLGVVAISQIRHSRGKLYGMRLAVFDALLFPLLLLDGLLFVFSALVAMAVLSSLLGDKVPQWSSALLPFLISLPIIAWVDWRIARAVWRMAIGYQAADVAKPRGDIAPRRGFLARCLAGPEQPFQASYTRWVFLPMLVLVGLWLVVAVIVQIKYGHPNDYHPIVIADTHTLAGLAFILTLPVLLLVRWMQQLPGEAYLTLVKRLALCVVCLSLGIVAWTVAFTSPWNHVHVQVETANFVPRSKAYHDLLLTAEWFSHERTRPPYVEPDRCELRLWLRSSDTMLLRVLDVDLRGPKDLRRGHEGPLTREKFDRWTKDGPLLDTSNPAIKQELDELFVLVSTYPASVPVSWDSFLTFARTTLAHYDLGDYRHSGTSVRPENFTPFLWALVALPVGFLIAVAVSVGAARRSLILLHPAPAPKIVQPVAQPAQQSEVAEPVAPAAAQSAAGKLTARAYWLTFGAMALAWWMLPLMWPLGNWGLLIACLLIGWTVTWSARCAANLTPATAERWASRGPIERAGFLSVGVVYGALGAYFLFLAATHVWDRAAWNYWAQGSDEFLQTYRGAEHRLLEELASYKENPPRAELADWGFSWSFGIDFVTSTKPAPRHFGNLAIMLYVVVGAIWLLSINTSFLSSRRHAWLTTGWEQIWPSLGLIFCTLIPLAAYCYVLWAVSMINIAGNPVVIKQVRAAESLETITERMNHWATDNGYVEGDHYQWLVREIPGHKDLATAKITQFWQPSVFDRWTITRRGLVRKTPHVAVRIVADSNNKETVVNLSMPSNATDSPESIPLRDALASLVEALETGPKTSK